MKIYFRRPQIDNTTSPIDGAVAEIEMKGVVAEIVWAMEFDSLEDFYEVVSREALNVVLEFEGQKPVVTIYREKEKKLPVYDDRDELQILALAARQTIATRVHYAAGRLDSDGE